MAIVKNQWFRMYAEFAFDPKVQVLTEALQRRYVMALCLHCDDKLENRPNDEIALALRVTVDEWQDTKQEFIKRGLFTEAGIPTAWNKRQYISDIKDPTATERQKRYRQNKRNDRNATVTSRLPEADTETQSEKKVRKNICRISYPPEFENLEKKYPRRDGSKEKAFESYQAALKRGIDHGRLESGVRAYADYVARERTENRHIAHFTTWLNQSRWESDYSPTSQRKPDSWASAGNTLAAKYAVDAEREEQAAISAPDSPNLCITEAVRQDTSGIGDASGGVQLGVG
jgi:hypothetical protein